MEKKRNKEKVSFIEMLFSIDEPFREKITIDFIKAFFILIIGIIISIILKQLSIILIALLCFVILGGIAFYKVLACTEGLCHIYEGECLGVKYDAHPSCVIRLNDGSYLEIFGDIKKSKLTKGDIVVAYIPYKSITEVIVGSSYKTHTCYYIYIKQKSYGEYQNEGHSIEKRSVFGFKKKR